MENPLLDQLTGIVDGYAEGLVGQSTDRFLKGVATFVKTHDLTQEHIDNFRANLGNGERPSGYNDTVYFMKHTPEQVAEHRSVSVAYNVPGESRHVGKLLPDDIDADGSWGSAVKSLEERTE